jgi:hypothetical protein
MSTSAFACVAGAEVVVVVVVVVVVDVTVTPSATEVAASCCCCCRAIIRAGAGGLLVTRIINGIAAVSNGANADVAVDAPLDDGVDPSFDDAPPLLDDDDEGVNNGAAICDTVLTMIHNTEERMREDNSNGKNAPAIIAFIAVIGSNTGASFRN